MDRLKQAFVDMGFFNLKTYIQSGNVIFQAQERDKIKLTKKIENQLQKYFSFEIKTLLLRADELAETVENAPQNFGAEPEKCRYDLWFLLPPTTANEVVSFVRLREGIDFLQAGKHAIYTSGLRSQMGRSYLSKIIQTPVYKNITIRNWNTTTKLLELMSTKNNE
ncbi:MAG: DUF1697 domain-containing protein [Cystobacterineae bacterium]|nr:DUF1697 domain-containing protein [Cystobacterineae bacterium]